MTEAKYLGLTANELAKVASDLDAENAKLREYAHSLEVANIEITSRLMDYIGQYDPTEAYVIEARADNGRLRELAHAMLQYIDPASHQDTCGIECPAHSMCKGKSMCSFPDWAVKEAGKIGIEVDE